MTYSHGNERAGARLSLYVCKTIAIALLLLVCPGAGHAEQNEGSRPLTDDETKLFLPLVCENPQREGNGYRCKQAINYAGNDSAQTESTAESPISIFFEAIVYGRFSENDEDEAYITYSSNMESHGTNYGGGILFTQQDDTWKLVKWYPGSQMERCLLLPEQEPTKMLCLDEYIGGMERYRFVSVKGMSNGEFQTIAGLMEMKQSLLIAADKRSSSIEDNDYFCKTQQDKTVLLSIKGLKKSDNPDSFAQADITYMTPEKIRLFCNGKKAHGKTADDYTLQGIARFEVDGTKINVILPNGVPAMPPDA